MHKITDFFAMFICRIGIAGLAPKVPGTFGSIAAVILAPWLFLPFDITTQMFILSVIFITGGIAGSRAEKICMVKDPSEVVIDELLGQWITLLPISELSSNFTGRQTDFIASYWPWLLLGLVLFRIFDILKPWPIKSSENWLPGGFGIMLDDLIAGIFAGILLLGFMLLIKTP